MRAFLFGPVLRLVPVGILFLAVQRAIGAEYPLHGVKLQIVLALVVAAAVGAGSERGALGGFLLGLMYDLDFNTHVGQTALAFGLAGLVAGYVMAITPDPQWWLGMLFAGLGALVGVGSIPVILLLTGDDGWITSKLIWILPVNAILAALLSPLLVALGRWCLVVKRPKWKALPE